MLPPAKREAPRNYATQYENAVLQVPVQGLSMLVTIRCTKVVERNRS
jgi:hypothetical protein